MLAMFSKYNFFSDCRSIGGIAASLVRVPTEVCKLFFLLQIVLCCIQIRSHCIQVIKQRMQTGQFRSAPDAVRLIVAKEGFKGLYAVCIPSDFLLLI
jgi:solute carrier family 25 (mitochondrial S-adenosylmethionine transporter), member 26